MKKKIVITGITGAIGGATALELSRQNHHLIMLGRSAQKLEAIKSKIVAESGNKDVEVVQADLSEPDSIRKAVAEIKSKHQSLDALLNVAAIFLSKRGTNSKGQELTFATNHLGPFVLTNELLPLLKKSEDGRVITVTAPSTTKVNFDDINAEKKYSSGFLGSFGASKMANLLFTYSLNRKLQGSNITTMAFHPGLVKSELTNEMPALMNWIFKKISSPPDKAAKMLSALATEKQYAGNKGKFMKFDGKELKSSSYSYDTNVQDKLWKLSEGMV